MLEIISSYMPNFGYFLGYSHISREFNLNAQLAACILEHTLLELDLVAFYLLPHAASLIYYIDTLGSEKWAVKNKN